MKTCSTRIGIRQAAGIVAALALAAGISGCRVKVDKGANGDDKNVQIDTPFGGLHVNTDQTSAADLGLPVYPGAEIVRDKDNEKSADIHMGFGEWELRVEAVNYATADSEEQVTAFYKKALGRYGNVIACKDNAPVGMPDATSEGLTCSGDKSNAKVKIDNSDYGTSEHHVELKAGSRHHQHIMGFDNPKDGKTRFALVVLDLPAGVDTSGKSD